MRVEDIEMTFRLSNCLLQMGIETVEELATRTPGQLLRGPGFGQKCLKEVAAILKSNAHALAEDPRTKARIRIRKLQAEIDRLKREHDLR